VGHCNAELGFCELNAMGGKKIKRNRKSSGVRTGTGTRKGMAMGKVTGGRKGKRMSNARRVTRRIRNHIMVLNT
jgi:hypothetical protein